MKLCPECGAENPFWRVHCHSCHHALKPTPAERALKPREVNDGFDEMGFAIGVATGIPLSPSRGISTGALIGAMLHPSESPDVLTSGGGGSSGGGASAAYEPDPDPAPSVESASSSDSDGGSSVDSSSDSSSSSDSGGSSDSSS